MMYNTLMKKNVNKVIGEYIKMIEKIANGRTNILNFGEGLVFYRGEIHMIKMIGDAPGIHISEIARNFNITRAAVAKTVLKLEKKRILIRETDAADKKILRLYLTEKGEEAYLAHQKYHQDFDGPLFDYLDQLEEDQLAIVEAFLEKANEQIDHHF